MSDAQIPAEGNEDEPVFTKGELLEDYNILMDEMKVLENGWMFEDQASIVDRLEYFMGQLELLLDDVKEHMEQKKGEQACL